MLLRSAAVPGGRRRRPSICRLAAALSLLAVLAPVPAAADEVDEVDPWLDTWPADSGQPADVGAAAAYRQVYVANLLGASTAAYSFVYTGPDTEVVAGDWDGDGKSGFASRQANVFALFDEKGYGAGSAAYGRADDRLLIGDWDGNGTDTFGVRRANQYFLRNTPTTGVADIVFAFGKAGDQTFVGDWNGDGIDTFAVRRANVFFVRNSTTTGVADTVFAYGRAGDETFAGDWDGDGIDTFAVRRGNQFFVRNDFRTGVAQMTFAYGRPGDQVLVGDWDDDGTDTFALLRSLDGPDLTARTIIEQNFTPFATTGGITLTHPSTRVELIGFHQSGHDGSQAMAPASTAVANVVLPTRLRGTDQRSAADIVVEPHKQIRSPVSGTVLSSGTYALYCQYRDDYLYIAPDAQPTWQVRIFHIDGVQVSAGQRVVAGVTVIAPRATQLPFASQVDAYTGEPSWPHVHVEVVNPAIPDRSSGGC